MRSFSFRVQFCRQSQFGWTCARVMASQTNREWLEEFIELYRSEPCLWNTKGKEYHNRELKRSAYTKLIEKLKIIDPSADKDAVVKKINNIRSTYKKERKKIADSKKSGAGTQEVYKPKLWYYSMLLFLDDQVEPRHSCSNMDDESTDNEEIESEAQSSLAAQSTSQSSPAAQSTSESSPAAQSTSQSPTATQSTPETRSIANTSFNRSCSKRNANEILTTEVLQSVQNHFKRPAISNEFGANVAAKLRDLTKHQRILAEKIINETLFLAEMENLTISHQVTDSTSVRFTNYSYNVPSPVSHTPSPDLNIPSPYQNSNFEIQTHLGSQSILQTSQQVQSQQIQNSAAAYLTTFDINTN
ncbi:uncharacterized protein LOC123865057 [Maniola jurtina]|uniref:uncharacterized protein LOC123865057 n=1 Tax=Maniola jurtina TaxID=191418 RepID=UPI001E688385|nr:uncharacterized protein LOC123865057 [Maniola jurtina]